MSTNSKQKKLTYGVVIGLLVVVIGGVVSGGVVVVDVVVVVGVVGGGVVVGLGVRNTASKLTGPKLLILGFLS